MPGEVSAEEAGRGPVPSPGSIAGGGSRPEVAAVRSHRAARRRLRRTLKVILFLLVFNNLVWPQLGGARKALHTLAGVRTDLLAAGLGLELAALVAYSQLTRVALGPQPGVSLFRMARIQLATKSVTNLVPGGSAAGSALGYRLLTGSGVPGTGAGFALVTAGLGSAVVLNVLLWSSIAASLPRRGVNPAYVVTGMLGLVVIAVFAAIVVLLMKGRRQAERAVRAIARRVRFVPEDRAARVIGRLADRLQAIARDPVLVRRAALWASANWLLDAGSLWVFLRAFGTTTPVDGLLVAFCLANVSAAIPITPGGLGVVEAVLTSTLVGFGLTRATAAVGVVTYRLAAFWLPIPLGAVAYLSLRVGRRPAQEAIGTSESRLDWAERHGPTATAEA